MKELNLIISNLEVIQAEFKQLAAIPAPFCECGCCQQEDDEYQEKDLYECEGCKRQMWLCHGQADQFWEYCDDCWQVLDKSEELQNKKPKWP